MKGSSQPLILDNQEANTTILDLKTHYATQSQSDVSKIKLLYNKRPASDLKTLQELLPDPTPSSIELSVMVLGGSSTPSGVTSPPVSTPTAVPSSPAVEIPDPTQPTRADQQDPAPLSEKAEVKAESVGATTGGAAEVVRSELFWSDLKDFLVQRLRDEEAGERLLGVFRAASESAQ